MRIYSKAVSTWDERLQRYVSNESASTFNHWIGLPVIELKQTDAQKQQQAQLDAAQTQAALGYYQQLPWQQNMAQQQMDLYNKQMQGQIDYQNQALAQQQNQYQQYMALMQSSLAGQQKIQGQVTSAMTPYLTGDGQGYSTGQMNALNTQDMSQIAQGYGTANSNLKSMLLAHGEGDGQPLSGTAITNMAGLQSALMNQTSGMRNQNLLDSYNQALTNKFQAANAMMGVSGQLGQNVGIGATGTQASTNAFQQGANSYAVNPVAQMPGQPGMVAPMSNPPGFWDGLASSFGGALMGGVGSAFTDLAGKYIR